MPNPPLPVKLSSLSKYPSLQRAGEIFGDSGIVMLLFSCERAERLFRRKRVKNITLSNVVVDGCHVSFSILEILRIERDIREYLDDHHILPEYQSLTARVFISSNSLDITPAPDDLSPQRVMGFTVKQDPPPHIPHGIKRCLNVLDQNGVSFITGRIIATGTYGILTPRYLKQVLSQSCKTDVISLKFTGDTNPCYNSERVTGFYKKYLYKLLVFGLGKNPIIPLLSYHVTLDVRNRKILIRSGDYLHCVTL